METSQPVENPAGLSSTKSSPRKRHTRWTAKTRRDFARGMFFISPWIIGFLAFTLYPMVASFIYGFTEYHIRQPTLWVGLQNYIELFQDKLFWEALSNTLYMVIIGVPLTLLFSFICAVALNLKVRGQSFYLVIYFLPSIVPIVASTMLWLWILNPSSGLFNSLLGWISLSCQNTSSSGTNAYGVTNDGSGTIGGHAWSENKGWINFAPTGAGVVINGCTGVFSGRAWSENAGWITFSSTGPNPYQVATSWRGTCSDKNACTTNDTCSNGTCVGTPITAPPETQGVAVAADKTTFSWAAAAYATQYAAVRGSLGAFPVGPGDADEVCFDNLPGPSLSDTTVPGAGSGFWYLSRGENACGGPVTVQHGRGC